MTDIPKDVAETVQSIIQELDDNLWRDARSKEVIARAILAERERCAAGIEKVIKEGMATIADELAEPSMETVKLVAQAIRENPPDEIVDYDQGGNKFLDVDYEDTARAAITAIRGAFFADAPSEEKT